MASTKVIFTTIIWGLLLPIVAYSQITNVVVLDSGEIATLREVIAGNSRAAMLYDSVANLAHQHLSDAPRPLERLYYEGLLNNHPDRIDTRKSLEDMDKVIDFIYASYGRSQDTLAQKIRQFVLAWANAYQLEWASYYQPAWYEIVGDHGFTSTWVGLLNSPLVRKKSDVR